MSDEATRAMLGVYAGVGLVPAHELKLLAGEIIRLRAVIASAERNGDRPGAYPMCPWCQSEPGDAKRHADCPAFSAEGVVR